MFRSRWLILVICAAAISWPDPVMAQTTSEPEIVVTGTGTATFNPDRATLVIEVRTEASTPREAGGKNAPLMKAILESLRRMGYSADKLRTRGYTVQPTYRYDPSGPQLTGYAAFNAITIRLDQVERVGETLDTALAAGATRVGSVRFESTNQERVRREALERAFSVARHDAEALARAAGGTLGELVSVSTDARATREESIAAAAGFARAIETPILAGEQTVVATVQARWRFLKQ